MWSKFKSLPVLPKVLIVCSVIGLIYAATNRREPDPNNDRSDNFGRPSGGYNRQESPRTGSRETAGEEPSSRPATGQGLARFKAQQAQLMAQVNQCEAQMTQATQQMAMNAMNGSMVNNRPPCEQYMAQWTSQEAYLETEIYRLQTGDTRSSVRQITGIPAGSYAGSRSSSSSPYASPSSDGTAAVENWDRQGVRGNSMYTDENGEQQELPTENYYYRDRSSGQVVPSDQPNPPNDGHDYEQLQSSDPQQ